MLPSFYQRAIFEPVASFSATRRRSVRDHFEQYLENVFRFVEWEGESTGNVNCFIWSWRCDLGKGAPGFEPAAFALNSTTTSNGQCNVDVIACRDGGYKT